MSKVIKAELSATEINSLLEKDAEDARNLRTSLNAFVNRLRNSNDLKGKNYSDVANKIESVYLSALNTRIAASMALKSAISNAVSEMDAFVGNDDPLDDSTLEEVRTNLNNAKTNYNNSVSLLNSINNGKNDSDTNIDSLSSDISYYENQIKTLKLAIEKLEKLPSIDSSLFGKIESVQNGTIANYKNTVNNIQVGNVVINSNISVL